MTDSLIVDSAAKIFADTCNKNVLDTAERGEFPEALWEAVCENGFHLLALPDSGAGLGDLFAVVRAAGRQALPVPLAEALLANRWLGHEGDGLVSVGLAGNGGAWSEVPWGRIATRVLGVTAANELFVACPESVVRGANMAGEARDTVTVGQVEPVEVGEPVYATLALSRVAASAGALERVLEMGLRYAGEREQFGRPIARFQAVQHNLAMAAAEVAAAVRASDAAVEAIGGKRFELEVAAAKSRVGEAAGVVVEAIHQVHGAIGFTYEHELHHYTRRLWAWREEFGGEVYWQTRLGERIAALGADAVWDFVATPR
ncbi:MAG: acyl-CoA dehydrogenase family protein [Gammaproteobacteria bacterium]|nr:acyl-CoA dehydrogenase family protein [Gammaproteobacteria bacterium]